MAGGDIWTDMTVDYGRGESNVAEKMDTGQVSIVSLKSPPVGLSGRGFWENTEMAVLEEVGQRSRWSRRRGRI